MPNAMETIEHLVVLMFENRSLDNVLGWLYADQRNRPPLNFPDTGAPPTYDGLVANTYWNPANPLFLTDSTQEPGRVYATRGTLGPQPFTVPTPGPAEDFERMTYQLFGTTKPAKGQQAAMLGFLADYQRQPGVGWERANQAMQTYAPEQLPVFHALARNYAVSDRWFASVPAQTWPNRAFIHAGTSQGHVNNWPLTPYDVKTVYQALEEHQVSWGMYYTHAVPPFGTTAQLMMKQLRASNLRQRVHPLDTFLQQAADGTLPMYAFIEPDFLSRNASDMHPPHDVRAADQFLFQIYDALRRGRGWEKTVLVVLFDEHGGCYDHVPPPWGATPPDAQSRPGDHFFGFDRFGVRVPALLVSPWVEAGTVFRSPTPVPFDHTSVLRTLRDWAGLPDDFLPSARVAQAPSFAPVLARSSPRQDVPDVRPDTLVLPQPAVAALRAPPLAAPTTAPQAPAAGAAAAGAAHAGNGELPDFEKSIVVAVENTLRGHEESPDDSNILDSVHTHEDLTAYLQTAEARAVALGQPVPKPA